VLISVITVLSLIRGPSPNVLVKETKKIKKTKESFKIFFVRLGMTFKNPIPVDALLDTVQQLPHHSRYNVGERFATYIKEEVPILNNSVAVTGPLPVTIVFELSRKRRWALIAIENV
jgi:hypothetical protein